MRDNYNLSELLYPLKANSSLAPILLLKLSEIEEERQKALEKYHQAYRYRDEMYEDVPDPPPTVARAIDALVEARRTINECTVVLQSAGFDIATNGRLVRRRSDAEMKELRDRRAEEQNAIEKHYHERVEAVRETARKMIAARIKTVRSSVPRDLLEELDRA